MENWDMGACWASATTVPCRSMAATQGKIEWNEVAKSFPDVFWNRTTSAFLGNAGVLTTFVMFSEAGAPSPIRTLFDRCLL
eukprot:18781_6